jgi:hypothetical protein
MSFPPCREQARCRGALSAVLILSTALTAATAVASGGHTTRVDPRRPEGCLAKRTDKERTRCFRRTAGRYAPHAVARCLREPSAAERSACFRRMDVARAGVPAPVQACLDKPSSDRGTCFTQAFGRGGAPAWVDACLARADDERGRCFADHAPASPPEPGVPDSVAACLAMPPDQRGACFSGRGG